METGHQCIFLLFFFFFWGCISSLLRILLSLYGIWLCVSRALADGLKSQVSSKLQSPLTFTISLLHLSWRWLTHVTAARWGSGNLNLFFTLKRGGQQAARRCRHTGPCLTMTHLWQDEDDVIDILPLTAHHKFRRQEATWIRLLCRFFTLCPSFYMHAHILCVHVYRNSLHLGLKLIETQRTSSLFLV